MDEIDDKSFKRNIVDENLTIASRRSVRRKAKPKNEDFEYDLSNLLKKEAQGYRDSQIVLNPKACQVKKKVLPEITVSFENQDFCGSLITLSKKAVEISAAHMKTTNFPLYTIQKEIKPSTIFVRPMIPKTVSKIDKISPKKDVVDENKNNTNKEQVSNIVKADNSNLTQGEDVKAITTESIATSSQTSSPTKKLNGTNDFDTKACVKKLNIPSGVPFKIRRESLELIKSPLMNKNISELTKAGMKTKILVIKPINRNNDGSKTSNAPIKFQTIKLKDSHTTNEEKSSDQVVVVKVPKVSTVDRSVVEKCSNIDSNNEQIVSNSSSEIEPMPVSETILDMNENNPVMSTIAIENNDHVYTESEVIITSEELSETIPQSDNNLDVEKDKIIETLLSDPQPVENTVTDEPSIVPS